MGERFGNYELLEKVAVGGMAEIFKARASHARGVEKLVCIKRIHPALSADRIFVAMFIDEARLGVSMAHGNIVPVFDFGYVDGHYFLAMEYVEGNDLATLCGRARVVEVDWPPQLAVYVVMEILEGLSYAHRKRDDQGRPLELVHRDVSPSNVLISTDGQVKLLDFGIARSQAREFETRTGVIKGKPGYMSPEQAAAQTVDARADVWSCGAVLYELLTGSRLKEGRRKLDDEGLEKVLDKALVADREKRYSNAGEMQVALGAVLEDRSWRPYPRDLSAFIQKVHSAAAPGENWDMKSTAVEKHLADALESARPGEDDQFHTETARITETLSEIPEPPTALATTTEDAAQRKGARTRTRMTAILAAGAVLLIALVGIAIVLGYSPGVEQVEPAEPEQGHPGSGSGKVKLGTLSVSSVPSGAIILLGGEDTGELTPATLSLEPDTHRIELLKEGYVPWEARIEITGGNDEPVNAQLLPARASLSILTEPPGADISVDGEPRGKSPLGIEGLEPGTYTVSASMQDRVPQEEEISLGRSETAQLKLVLPARSKVPIPPRKKAVLNVVTSPWSQVVLDGQSIGQTPIRNMSVNAGKHTVVLNNPVGGVSRTIRFTLKPGEVKLISEKLDQ